MKSPRFEGGRRGGQKVEDRNEDGNYEQMQMTSVISALVWQPGSRGPNPES